jgi:hypothetical protein
MPASVSRPAKDGPAWPVPMTMASKLSVMRVFPLSGRP